MSNAFCVAVTEATQVGEARRSAARLAEGLGMGEDVVGRVSVVVTELAGNLVKHTRRGGELIIRAVEMGRAPGVEILALDRGEGMADVGQCLRDGYSTAGSPGTGLGAVQRMSDLCQIHSGVGVGTAILSRIGPEGASAEEAGPVLGVVNQNMPGQGVCGDDWAARIGPERTMLMVADGLGHGAGAAEASQAAARVARESAGRGPVELIELMHRGLRSTRGAAVAVAEIDERAGKMRFAAVGNIAGAIIADGESRSVTSQNGIVGSEMRTVQEMVYAWPPSAMLILHSDGLSTKWELGRYPGLAMRHPSLIAGVLYRDFNRGTDDATVAVLRGSPARGEGVV